MLVHGNPHSAVLRVHNKVEWVVDARKLDVLLIEALVTCVNLRLQPSFCNNRGDDSNHEVVQLTGIRG